MTVVKQKTFKPGDVVNHKYRKSACYLVVEEKTGKYLPSYALIRVKKQTNYPIAATKSVFSANATELTLVASPACHKDINRKKAIEIMTELLEAKYNRRFLFKYEDLDVYAKKEFEKLSVSLSPEWLTCDGELSSSQVSKKRARLIRAWHNLQNKYDVDVTPDEVEGDQSYK